MPNGAFNFTASGTTAPAIFDAERASDATAPEAFAAAPVPPDPPPFFPCICFSALSTSWDEMRSIASRFFESLGKFSNPTIDCTVLLTCASFHAMID